VTDQRVLSVTVERTERLDRFLADQLALSRTQAARLVAEGGVRVNGQPGRAGRCLGRGDLVEVSFPADRPPRILAPRAIELDVVFEDEHLIIINKPAGLVVHPAPGHWDDTLVNALVARGTSLSALSAERPGIVHRLDKETSGLMMVAKSETVHRRLARDLERRRIRRSYAALTWGHIKETREIDAPIARHPNDRKRMLVVATGRSARTTVEPIARFDVCDLVRAVLHTGRTHQIRVHMAHIGHPVVGDAVYGGGGARRIGSVQRGAAEALERATPRQALHAAWLRFGHPVTGADLDFRAPWPPDLDQALGLVLSGTGPVDRASALDYLGFFQ